MQNNCCFEGKHHLLLFQIITVHLVVELAAVRHAAGHAQTLAQGPGGYVDEAEPEVRVTNERRALLTNHSSPGGGVTLQIRVDLAQVHEVAGGEQPGLRPRRVQDGRGMALGQDEPGKI